MPLTPERNCPLAEEMLTMLDSSYRPALVKAVETCVWDVESVTVAEDQVDPERYAVTTSLARAGAWPRLRLIEIGAPTGRYTGHGPVS